MTIASVMGTPPSDPKPFVSIVVPAFNEERLLGPTLSAIKDASSAFHRRGWLTEIVVCDNNSSDRTAELARKAGATVVFEPVNQIGRARNTGARASTGEWILFVDADSRPDFELFDDVADAIASGKYIAGGSTLRLETKHRVAAAVTTFWNGISRVFRLLAGSFIFCQATAFRETGGFNEELFASEEIELSARLKRYARARGKKLVILSKHPMITSDRKVHLYSFREHMGVLGRIVLTRQKSLKSREHCSTWYDGRR